MVFITHDLGVVATVAERVLILQTGPICEEGAQPRCSRSAATTTPRDCSKRRQA